MRKKFTLIELLVVIAIIAILASMLLPALNRARDRGKSAKCVSNLKNLHLMLANYMHDNNGRYPYTVLATLGEPISNTKYPLAWHRLLAPTLFPYAASSAVGIFRCPSQISVNVSRNYTISSELGGVEADLSPRVNLNRIRRPSATVSNVDGTASLSVMAINGWETDAQWLGEQVVHWRHSNMANVSYVDGHVGKTSSAKWMPFRLSLRKAEILK